MSIPTRSQLEPHLQTLLASDDEHLRLTSALAQARAALGPTLAPEVLALLDASTDLVIHDLGVEARLLWEAGRTYGAASALSSVQGRPGPRGVAGLLGEPDMDPVELALQAGVDSLTTR